MIKAQDPSWHKIQLTGELTKDHFDSIKKQFQQAFQEHDAIQIHFDSVTDVDFWGLQLLYSVVQTAQSQKKTLLFSPPLPPNLTTLIADTGFDSLEWMKFMEL